MVIHEDIIDNVEQLSLDEFDLIDFMGFSNDGSTESPSADVLAGELLRKALTVKDKDTGLLTYEFDGLLGLTEFNGNDLLKFGLFDTIGGNDLQFSQVLDTGISKTADREINVGFQLSVEVEDLT